MWDTSVQVDPVVSRRRVDRRTRRLRWGLAAAVLGTALAPVPARGGGADDDGTRTLPVRFHFEEAALAVDGAQCRLTAGRPAPEETCKLHLVGPSFFTGAVSGVAALDYSVWSTGTKTRFTGVVPVKGRVEDCGTGSFVMDFPYGIVHNDQFDPLTQSVPGRNTWTIRPGSGSGGLRNLVSGGGEVTFRAYPLRGHDGERTFADGEFTGTVRCVER